MKNYNLKSLISRVLLLGVVFLSASSISAAVVNCSTIAQIKEQADKTDILYTGTATTTFYNGQWSGIFIQDETGAVLLKGIDMSNNTIKPNMQISNITAKYAAGSKYSAQGIKIDSKNVSKVVIKSNDAKFIPEKVKLDAFVANPKAYEYKAIVLEGTKVDNIDKKYMITAGSEPIEVKSEISTYPPKAGDFAGCYLSYNNRFILASAEYTNPTAFDSFKDCQSYYTNIKPKADASYSIDGFLNVNYVFKKDGKNYIFAEFPNNQITLGLTIVVDGETTVAAGDKICGLKGSYTAAVKDFTNKEFKGGIFNQTKGNELTISSKNNEINVTKDVNVADLVSFKLANDFHAKVVASRYIGKLTQVDGVYKYSVEYVVSVGGEDDNTVEGNTDIAHATINVVAANGTDLSKYVNTNVIIAGVYDAKTIYAEPTLVVRNKNDIAKDVYQFSNIKDMIDAGQPISKSIVYELTNEPTVTFVKTQNNTSGPQTWAFIEDNTAKLAIDLGNIKPDSVNLKAGDVIKNVKGSYNDGTLVGKRISAPRLAVNYNDIVATGKTATLNYTKVTLKDLMDNKLKYGSSIVEITNVYYDFIDRTTNPQNPEYDHYLYQLDDKDKVIAEMHFLKPLHVAHDLYDLNNIKGLVNYNCLDGSYVIYSVEVEQAFEGGNTAIENNEINNSCIYSCDNSIVVECEAGSVIDVYTLQGQRIYSVKSVSEKTFINNLNGMFIVKVGNDVNKVLVK